MLSTVCLLVVLLGVVSVAADNPPPLSGNPNGLSVSVLSNSISVSRQLPTTTMPPPTTPAGSLPPQMTTPPASPPPPPPTNASGVTMPPSPSLPQGMSSASPLPTSSTPALTTGVITLTVASIRELDSNFTQVVSTPPNIVNGLSGNGIIMPNPLMATILGSNPTIQISCQSIQNTLSSVPNASLTINLCGILNNGTVTYDSESSQVAVGQLGLSVQIIGWPWTATGKYLEFNVSMSVMTGRTMSLKSGSPVTLGLGATDSYALLSTQVTNPQYSSFRTMPNGYPMLTQNAPVDNKASVTAMLPFGFGPIVWNAVIEPGYQPSQKPPGPVSAAASLLASWIIHAITAALACLAGSFDRRMQ